MTLSLQRAADVSIPDLADLFTRSFAGYIGGPVHIDVTAMAAFLARENVDLTLSRVLLRDDVPAGMIFISRQGWTSRVAGMGVIPDAQSKGAGSWFLGQAVEEAKSRGEHEMVLECFEQNTRALKLYERTGFTIVRRLYGYNDESLEAVADPGLSEVDIMEAAQHIIRYGARDLPWQVSGIAIARFGPPFRAYRLGHAYAVISDPSLETIVLRGLIVAPDHRQQSLGKRLMQAMKAAHPGKKWSIPQIFPDTMGVNFFEKCGFVRKELNQVQMALDLRQ